MKQAVAVSLFPLIIITGCKQEASETPMPSPPMACLTIPSELQDDAAGLFDASCSTNADTFHWYFGDESQSTDKISQHSYSNPGTYTVKLVVEKGGMKDSIQQEVVVTKKPLVFNSCLPAYARAVRLWPQQTLVNNGGDSIRFVYKKNNQLDQIVWHASKYSTSIYSIATFKYDEKERPNAIDIYSGTNTVYIAISVTYDNVSDLPNHIYIQNALSGDTIIIGDFAHNTKKQLTDITYHTDGSTQNTRYEYDAYGNTTKVYYLGYTGNTEKLVRENIEFYESPVMYSASKELRFYLEYVAGKEPYVNNVKRSHIFESRGGPGWGYGYQLYGTGSGVYIDYTATTDSETNLPWSLQGTSEYNIPTDMCYIKSGYNCPE